MSLPPTGGYEAKPVGQNNDFSALHRAKMSSQDTQLYVAFFSSENQIKQLKTVYWWRRVVCTFITSLKRGCDRKPG